MTCDLYIDQRVVGTVRQQTDGCRILLTASCPLLGDGIYKAFLVGEAGRLPIGVMMPQNGTMLARRSIAQRELASLGTLTRGEAIQTVRFGAVPTHGDPPQPSAAEPTTCVPNTAAPDQDGWIPEPRPERLFAEPSVAALWDGIHGCYRKQDGDCTLLAAVIRNEAPFSPVPMFCLGKAEAVNNRQCLVFRLNREGHPVPME